MASKVDEPRRRSNLSQDQLALYFVTLIPANPLLEVLRYQSGTQASRIGKDYIPIVC
jgi:hypothetical protein